MTKIDIFSGFLGAGKTTLIKKLIAEAYTGEQLVLIENEFGEIGIDGGFLQEAGINITEMNSGCICCSLVGDFGKALRQVMDTYHPDRILIEPSGVGKLSDVIRAVQNLEMHDVVLNGFTTVVDATKAKMYMRNFGEFFNNQVEHASAIILSRTAGMSQEKLDACVALLREKNPNAAILTTPWDQLDGMTILSAIEKVSLADELLAHMRAEHEADEAEHEHEHHHHHHDEDEHDHDHCCHHHDHDDDDDDDAPVPAKGAGGGDMQLLSMLKDLRRDEGKRLHLQPWIIFSDSSLEDMSIMYPETFDELIKCQGVGEGKAKKYGKPFLELITRYVEDNEISRPDDFLVRSMPNKSSDKIFIIQSVDRRMALEDIAEARNMEMSDLLSAMEGIVESGTKLNLDYYIDNNLDADVADELYEWFRTEAESDSLEDAIDALAGDYEEMEIRLVRMKFLSEVAN